MLIIFALLVALALWVVAGVLDARALRRPAPRVVQVQRVPPLPDRPGTGLPRPALTRADLARARHVRARRHAQDREAQ